MLSHWAVAKRGQLKNVEELDTTVDLKSVQCGWIQWLKPVTPATWEAEIGKIVVPGQSQEKVRETPSQPVAGCVMTVWSRLIQA
jgi:hypothetical protein